MYHLLREIFTRQNLGVVYFKALYQALGKQKNVRTTKKLKKEMQWLSFAQKICSIWLLDSVKSLLVMAGQKAKAWSHIAYDNVKLLGTRVDLSKRSNRLRFKWLSPINFGFYLPIWSQTSFCAWKSTSKRNFLLMSVAKNVKWKLLSQFMLFWF